MKIILVFLFSIHALPLLAQTPEIAGREDARAIVANVKDLEVTDLLKSTAEFKKCKDKYKLETGKTTTTGTLDEAVKCFKDQLKGKDEKTLQELSNALNLQSYGLVKSKNSKEIQGYLNDKMYEALTGINPKVAEEKKWIDEMKFSKKKHIDQATFIRLYKTQLSKNALFEISRYCFQDLRLDNKNETNFNGHWSGFSVDSQGILQNVNDFGEPKFAETINDPQDKEKVYGQLLQSITGSKVMTSEEYTKFFEACGKTMVDLCDKFKISKASNFSNNPTNQGATTRSLGSTSCISKNRIQELKTAIENAGKVEKQFAEMKMDNNSLMVALSGEPVKMFEAGKNGNASLDELTNYSSKDMLEGGAKTSSNSEQDECEKDPGNPSCIKLLGNEEAFNKAKHDLELEMTLKREAEMERVRKIVTEKDRPAIKEYLEKNGFYSILNNPNFESGKMTPEMIAEEVGKEFEAKKIAVLAQMNERVGKRQIKKDSKTQEATSKVQDALKESKQERARLAQVVMFNNIITSHLTLRRKTGEDQYEDVGRNVNPWEKEQKGLVEAKVKPELFQNLKATDSGKGSGIKGDEQIAGIEFIDSMLGKQKPKGK
jgi:hypothetical protein